MLESHFLDDRAKRVNEGIWVEIKFDLVKSVRSFKDHNNCNESILNDLITQISDLSDIRTGSGYLIEVMANTIAVKRRLNALAPVYFNPPKDICELESFLRS